MKETTFKKRFALPVGGALNFALTTGRNGKFYFITQRKNELIAKITESRKKQIKQHHYYRAEFRPKRIDDLKPDIRTKIGEEKIYQALWIIEDGQFKGQYAMQPEGDYWAPEEDLIIKSEATHEEYLKTICEETPVKTAE